MHRLPGSHGFDIILFFSTGSCCALKSNIPDIVFKKFLVINHAGIAVLVVNKISALINLRLLIGCGIESSVNSVFTKLYLSNNAFTDILSVRTAVHLA